MRASPRQFSAKDGTNPLHDFKDGVVRALQESEARRRSESQEGRKRIEQLTREIVELKEREQGRSRASPRRRRREPARGSPSRSTCTRRSSGSPRCAATAPRTPAASRPRGEARRATPGRAARRRGTGAGRIIFEAKDKRLSQERCLAELNEGMAARAAGFACSSSPARSACRLAASRCSEYEGNKLIVAVDRDEPRARPGGRLPVGGGAGGDGP